MLIAHAPAGYLIGKVLNLTVREKNILILPVCILGAVICDFDMIYQCFYDKMSQNHHAYWTHIPVYWSPLIPLALIVGIFSKKLSNLIWSFFAGVLSHLCLDSVIQGIKWCYPYKDEYYGLVPMKDIEILTNPTKMFKLFENNFFELSVRGWVYNLISHWTFKLEIAIVSVALLVFIFSFLKTLVKNR